ncbi:MAG: alpha/beta hydrolase [Anaerolineales bacterium]
MSIPPPTQAPPRRSLTRQRLGRGLLSVLALGSVALGYLGVVPPNLSNLASHPNPAGSYAEALERVAALQASEASGYNPLCVTQLLTHGHKTDRAIAFIHGYTNCSNQFLPLGRQLYDLGYNVLLVPSPHQGLADVMTTDLSNLTAEELAAYADTVVDIARGLGDHVSLGGLSQGGVVAGWAAQVRPDLDQAILIAPGFGLRAIPRPLTVLAANIVLGLPDVYAWWGLPPPGGVAGPLDPAGKQGYPRFSLHGLAQQLRLGFATTALARRAAPAARSILVITNDSDLAVDDGTTAALVAAWRAHGAANITTYTFPALQKLPHDLVDPGEPNSNIALTYPKLIELITAP